MLLAPFAKPLADAEPPSRPWAALLERFYGQAGLPVPGLERLDGHLVPPPFQQLLVHSADMTPTLESFYGSALNLTVLSREQDGDSYYREVVLSVANSGHPVEYGVIRICLDHLDPEVRKLVLREQAPFGGILQRHGVAHVSWPQSFFRVKSDPHMESLLGLATPGTLYGRRNVLLDGTRRLLAEVLEILPPPRPALVRPQSNPL
jgi:hypothetical protein